tara:strand:+ start:218 stop:1657 length:1440 start_codon:yes stop_codon:yes gene_type:complete
MTKARDIADFKFENIVDTGTEGTKVASGTTGQRGSTTGQWRYNTTTGFFEGRNASGTFSTLEPAPTVTSVDTTDVDSNAGGNITIRVNGTNFTSGGTIKFIANDATELTASTSTFVSVSSYDAVIARSSFVNSKEPYDVKYISSSGLTAQLDDQINVDTAPTWSTASGQIGGTIYEDETFSTTVSATDADGDTISYSLQSGTLPSGSSLNATTGVISSSNLGAVSSDTTSNFTLRATANSKTVDRAFNIVIKDNGIMGSAEAYFDPMNSKSWSGSGTTLTNLGTNASGNTTNLSLNNQSVATSGGITYIDYNSGNTSNIPSFTLGNFSGNMQNYTIAFFGKHLTTNANGVSFHYGNFTTSQAIGANYDNQNSKINHYNYGNDYTVTGFTPNAWQFIVLRKNSGSKEVWLNNSQASQDSSSHNSTISLPSNATAYYGSRGGSSPYDNGSTDMGMLACWPTSLSTSEMSEIWNRFKGDYGL